MRWKRGRRSRNVEDRQASGGGAPRRFPGRLQFPSGAGVRGRGMRRGGLGLVGTLIVVGLALAFGVDPSLLLQGSPGSQSDFSPGSRVVSPEEQQLADFVSVVLADTEDTGGRCSRTSSA